MINFEKFAMALIIFFDTEIDPATGKVRDIGAVRPDGAWFHSSSIKDFTSFIKGADFICGHNVLVHDIKYVEDSVDEAGISRSAIIDTLYLSPLLFPKKPYHSLLKDDKLQTDQLNNPLNDSQKARELFDSECAAFDKLEKDLKDIYFSLLGDTEEFGAFFRYVGYNRQKSDTYGNVSSFVKGLQSMFTNGSSDRHSIIKRIRSRFSGRICERCDLDVYIRKRPVALAYCLALIDALDSDSSSISVTPRWVLHNYPEVEQIMFNLRSNPCREGCGYCDKRLDIHSGLKTWFGFDSFRLYGGEPLQERAVRAAIENKSLLAVFPTGGGKSLTFQLPALMAGRNTSGLTVVISPLQSLMKDQVDNLEKKGITDAVTINGLLDPIERAKSIERVEDGSATILYISPESLRSKTIERLMLGRKIVRFVVDEAHCFSAWGQDFRVDYMYIAEFIRNLQQKKNLQESIPVSCFTATAKLKVIEDIRNYFKDNLSIDLELFTTNVSRQNLHYTVIPEENDEEKYQALRRLIEERECPVIVYVTRTRKAEELAARLQKDGFSARPYHGKMSPDMKTDNQNSFMSGETRIIVATSAFGMGVDKSDVGLVVHYQISDSLENYVQEAGRAGRDDKIEADCYVLYNDEDLSRHFILLNQTKLTIKEIQQIWKAIKDITRSRLKVSNSALEIARQAGWDDSISDIETRVRTAIASLEQAGYIKRGQNMPRVFATSIMARTAQEAIDKIESSGRFDADERQSAVRIIKSLISSRSVKRAQGEDAESRIDYISDRLGIKKSEVIHIINLLREENILSDSNDLTVYLGKDSTLTKAQNMLNRFCQVERFLLQHIGEKDAVLDYKELNKEAESSKCSAVTLDKMKVILNFWAIKNWIRKISRERDRVRVKCITPKDAFSAELELRHRLSSFIIGYLYGLDQPAEAGYAEFSLLGLKKAYESSLASFSDKVTVDDIEDALFYLSRTGIISIEGGFMVIYNALTIERLKTDNHIRYKVEDYQKLDEFYRNKVQQIHIVGEYARKMINDYESALQFVGDYFHLNYPVFLNKYFNGRKDEITQNITPSKFRQLFGELSASQLNIIKDKLSKYIVVAAGPGSGKTRVLVHKLASLVLMEDVKYEQMLMLTFSRAAATEFRQRLRSLIGNAVSFIDIRTFHSYCFDLLGMIGDLDKSDTIVRQAIDRILSGEVDVSRITKTVLVIDEAQDMDEDEFRLVKALMDRNEDMRVLAVGDDDQNIYAFRGSSPKYMEGILRLDGAKKYELVENYRSRRNLVDFSNQFASGITHRIKSYPIVPVRKENGQLEITRYKCKELAVPLVESLLHKDISGTTAVLTQKNEEALLVNGLLRREGIPSRLIQMNDDFRLSFLVEMASFKRNIFVGDAAVVPVEQWNKAKESLEREYSRSTLLPLCMEILRTFESICPESSDCQHTKIIYKSDFETFLNESSSEDFVKGDTGTVVVSTIHKSKGKEFDNVFLLASGCSVADDDARRKVYVALTRAKDNLYIYSDNDAFSGLAAEGLVARNDDVMYGKPSEMVIQLTMKDVWLDDFFRRQNVIKGLMSGDALYFGEYQYQPSEKSFLLNDEYNRPVVKFSKRFNNRLKEIMQNGYQPESAEINAILWWKNEHIDNPIMAVLPTMTFKLVQ